MDFYKMLLIHRNTPNKIDISPSKRLMGRWLRCHIPNISKYQEMVNSKDVQEKINENKLRSKQYYDRSITTRRELQTGENIWFKKFPQDEVWSKGRVESSEGNRSYNIQTPEGNTLRRNEVMIKPRQESAEVGRNDASDCEEENNNQDMQPAENTERTPPVNDNSHQDSAPSTSSAQWSTPSRNNSRPIRNRRPPSRLGDFIPH